MTDYTLDSVHKGRPENGQYFIYEVELTGLQVLAYCIDNRKLVDTHTHTKDRFTILCRDICVIDYNDDDDDAIGRDTISLEDRFILQNGHIVLKVLHNKEEIIKKYSEYLV